MECSYAFSTLVALIFAICPLICAFKYNNCPGPITVNTPANSATVAVSWQHPYLTGVGKSGSISQTVSHDPGEQFPIGMTRVNYLAINSTDYRDLQVCTFVITVHDLIPPVFHACPDNVTIRLGTDQTEAEVTWDVPQATDNSKYVQLLNDHHPGSNFTAGTVTVTYTARDKSGNEAHCVFPVIVIPFVTTTVTTTTTETTTWWTSTSTSEQIMQPGVSTSSQPGVVNAPPINWKLWAVRGLTLVSFLCIICFAIIGFFMFRKYRVIRRLKKARGADEETEIYPSSAGEEYDMWEDPPGSPAYQVNPAALAGGRGEFGRPNKAEERPLLVAGGGN